MKQFYEIKNQKELLVQQIELNKNFIVPFVFGNKEFDVVIKLLKSKKLNTTERSYLSRSIKNKLYACELLSQNKIQDHIIQKQDAIALDLKKNYYFSGLNQSPLDKKILNNRIKQSIILLSEIEKKYSTNTIYIIGSFLIKKEYNDIDILIIADKNQEFYEGKNHIILIKEKNIEKSHFFHSTSQISISNNYSVFEKKIDKNYKDLYYIYQEVIIQILNNDLSKDDLRDYFILSKILLEKKIMNSLELDIMIEAFFKLKKPDEKTQFINQIYKIILIKNKSNRFIEDMIKTNESLIKTYKQNDNLKIYNQLLKDAKNGY